MGRDQPAPAGAGADALRSLDALRRDARDRPVAATRGGSSSRVAVHSSSPARSTTASMAETSRSFASACPPTAPRRYVDRFGFRRASPRPPRVECRPSSDHRSRRPHRAVRARGRTLRHDEAFRVSDVAVQSMIDELTSRFMNALRDASPSEQQPALRDGADIVRRAEVALMRDGQYALRVDELCRATGVARRSLSRAFELILGIGPATYLRRYRLNEARRALLHDQHVGVNRDRRRASVRLPASRSLLRGVS